MKKNTTLYRLSIIMLKYTPVLGALMMWIHILLLLLGFNMWIAEYSFSLPFFPWLVCIVWSKTFGFCKLHRHFITYISIVSYCIRFQDDVGFGILLTTIRWIVFIIGTILLLWFITHVKKYNMRCFHKNK